MTAALLLATVPCSAQTLRGGIKAGAAFTSLSNIFVVTEGDEEESSVHTSAVYGGFVEWTLAPLWSFQPEVLLTSVGADLPDGSLGDAIVIRYLEFPLLIKIAPPADRTGLYLVAGPNVGVKLDASFRETDEDIDDRVRRTNWALTVGVGVQSRLWLVEGRFTQGLRTIGTDSFDQDVKTRSVLLLAGFRF